MRCPQPGCGEPWDLDSLHDLVSERWYDEHGDKPMPSGKGYEPLFEAARKDFNKRGCEAFGSRHNVGPEQESTGAFPGIPASVAYAALSDLLGDDVDGIESELEDLGLRF